LLLRFVLKIFSKCHFNNGFKLTALYFLFAGASSLFNIFCQVLFNLLYHGIYAVQLSILVGTLIGFPAKYFLEKIYIFSYRSKNIKHDVTLFFKYLTMSIITTLIFWSIEWGFHLYFMSDFMRYVGGLIGLSCGFYIKYTLDRKYVFIR
jgi:putative flippase GtrA